MVSAVFIFLGFCLASVQLSRAWWWQLPMLDRLRKGQSLVPWEEPEDLVHTPDSDNIDKLKLLLMSQPKRAFTLFSGKTNDPVGKMMQGKIGKPRKVNEGGRPRGHPLRWG